MEKRFDLTRSDAGKVERTPQGGVRVPANLTRIGVFSYHQPDGSTVRELRHPSEVFTEDSLASLADATVTIGHPGVVTPSTWKQMSIGHVKDVHSDGRFVAAKVVVQDASAVSQIERKELVEISCGYECDVIPGKGTYDGEEYDARQTNIRYNHVGLGPKDWGRAGNDVKLKLDSPYSHVSMDPDKDKTNTVIVHTDTTEVTRLRAEVDALKADNAKLKTEASTAQAKADAAALAVSPEAIEAKVQARVTLLDGARKVLGADFKADAKSTKDVYLEVVKKADSTFTYDEKKHSEDYMRCRFDIAVAGSTVAQEDLTKVNEIVNTPSKTDSKEIVLDARAEMLKRNATAWKGAPTGAK